MSPRRAHLSEMAARQHEARAPAPFSASAFFAADQPCSAPRPISPPSAPVIKAAPARTQSFAGPRAASDWSLPPSGIGATEPPEQNAVPGQATLFSIDAAQPRAMPAPMHEPWFEPAAPPALPTPEAHSVFERMGEGQSLVRSFDLGSIDIDAHLDRIERALSREASRDAPAPLPPAEADPMADLDLLSEIASLGAELSTPDALFAAANPDSPEDIAGIAQAPERARDDEGDIRKATLRAGGDIEPGAKAPSDPAAHLRTPTEDARETDNAAIPARQDGSEPPAEATPQEATDAIDAMLDAAETGIDDPTAPDTSQISDAAPARRADSTGRD